MNTGGHAINRQTPKKQKTPTRNKRSVNVLAQDNAVTYTILFKIFGGAS
jgi:hypothetical protein